LNMRELEAHAKALAPVLKGYVSKVLDSDFELFRSELRKDLDARDKKLIDTVTESFEGIPADLKEIAAAAAELIDKPADGRDADPEQIQKMVDAAVAQVPRPKDGSSVSVEDVLPAIHDEVARAVAELPAPKDGKDGADVQLEDVQRMVDEAVAKAVSAISLPKDGEPGRDAAHIEILPAIEEGKAYPRGSYAKHLGGLWRSFETTSGMKGWECIVEGIARLEVEQDGERGLKAVAILSSGATSEKSLQLPAMIYRGVFSSGDYTPGDTVTWCGSLWHCETQTSDKPGEPGSKGWRLAVKKGRDGKDGTNGKDLTKGVKIT